MGIKSTIVDALGEVKENLILNKYNDAMKLMAQITIDVIESLIDDSLIVSKGYEEDLKTLKSLSVLSDDTAHNFETLIISGVQAHNGVDIPKEHAEKALEVLTNELDMIYNQSKTNEGHIEPTENDKVIGDQVYEYTDDEDNYKGDFSKDMTTSPAFLKKDGEVDFRKKEKIREQILNGAKDVSTKKVKLMSIIIPIVGVLCVVILAKNIFAPNDKPSRNIELETIQIKESIEETETETEPTEPPLPPEAGYYDLTGNLVKIRDKATTEGSKVKATVSKGDKIYIKSFYNNDWAVVVYEGEELYISRRYIKKDETITSVSNNDDDDTTNEESEENEESRE